MPSGKPGSTGDSCAVGGFSFLGIGRHSAELTAPRYEGIRDASLERSRVRELHFDPCRAKAPEGMKMRVFIPLTVLCLLAGSASIPRERTANWSANYSACDGRSELLKNASLKLGVRFSTSNPELQMEFTRALDFWARVLDMEWHEDSSRACAIQVVDGSPGLFMRAQVARAQLPNRSGFQGWIAFNPGISLSASDQFLVAVHELGHLFGLPHNASASSIMFYLQLDEPLVLDSADLRELATLHKLRIQGLDQPLLVTASGSRAVGPRAASSSGL